MRKSEWFLIGVTVLSFVMGALFYPHLPALVATHWNAAGQVDGYMSRGWGAFTFPAIMVIVFGFLIAVPRMDPRKASIAKFRNYFDFFLEVFAVALYYIYLLTLLWNVGYQFNLAQFMAPALAALFYAIGVILPHAEPNFTIGIRTPWTISSPAVWRKTNDVGGMAFQICAVLALFGTALPSFAPWFFFAPVVLAAVGLVIYSYALYEKEKK